jgi:hypothetical protein
LIESKINLTQSTKRPFGVTIIAILVIVGGILLIFAGLSLLAFGVLFTAVTIEEQQQDSQDADLQSLTQFFAGFGIVIGSIVLGVGIGYLVVSYGLLKGKGWAWIVTLILTIIAIVIQVASVISSTISLDALVSAITSHIIGIAINGVILYYLYRPSVKAYFGRSSQTSTTIHNFT